MKMFKKIKTEITQRLAVLKGNKKFKIGIVIFLILVILSLGIYLFINLRQIFGRKNATPIEASLPFVCNPLTIVSLKNIADNSGSINPVFGEKCQFVGGFVVKLVYSDSKQALKAKLFLEAEAEGKEKQIDNVKWVIKDKNSSLFLVEGNRLGVLVLLGETNQQKVKNYLELGKTVLHQEKVTSLSSSSGNCEKISFKDGWEKFTLSIKGAQCDNFIDEASEDSFKFKCQDPKASWRLYFVKEQKTRGFKNLTIKAKLDLIDHAKFFEESGGIGVKYDNYVELLVSNEDVRSSLEGVCNKTAVGDEWSKLCVISEISPSIIGRCGIPKFTQSQECSVSIKSEGFDKIFLIFNVADAWLADVEGEISNLEICYEE